MKVYYAHFMGIYNTPQELRDIETLTKLGLEVINPNIPEVQAEVEKFKVTFGPTYNQNYMVMFEEVFFKRIRDCEVFAFRGLPDGRIPGGVAMELKVAQDEDKIIIELPCGTHSRKMDADSTKEYLRDIGER